MKYTVKHRIWIEVDNNILLGTGRADLLKGIQSTGSLSQAAIQMQMSYKKAWRLLDAMNKAGTSPVVETTVGGKDGGGATLTSYGIALIESYNTVNSNCAEFLKSQEAHFPQ